MKEIQRACYQVSGEFEVYRDFMKSRVDSISEELLQFFTDYMQKPQFSCISRLEIDENYKIILLDYNRLEIPMSALPKTLFIFFLRHTEGVYLHDLENYADELSEIYLNVSPYSDTEKLRSSITQVVRVDNPDVRNTNISRIKEAFLSKIGDEQAKNYYITGERGDKKRIHLDRNLWIRKK
ncbi:MAG: hypothetical protein M0P38_01820 [Bacteroidales bacterium]|jgi:hypothetical protein|nr:hypothetical protein [Bacteroidales bacterium]